MDFGKSIICHSSSDCQSDPTLDTHYGVVLKVSEFEKNSLREEYSRFADLVEKEESEGDGGLPLVHDAAGKGDVRLLVQAVQEDPSMLELQNVDGLTPLGQAVLSEQMDAAKRLVKIGANINAQDGIGRTCLSIAAYQGWYEGVMFLLRNGARQNICDKAGRFPIHAATYNKDSRTLSALLQTLSSDEINVQDNELMTALHWAAFHSRPEHVNLLLQRACDVMTSDVDGKVALHWAAQNGCVDCCRLLLLHSDCQRQVSAVDNTGKTPLHYAAAAGHPEILRYLALSPGCDLEVEDPDDRTPIHWAAAFGQVQCVEVLLELGVNAAVLDADGGSPLFYATQSGHSACVRLLQQAMNVAPENGKENFDQIRTSDNGSKNLRNPLHFFKSLFVHRQRDVDMGYNMYPLAAPATEIPDTRTDTVEVVSQDKGASPLLCDITEEFSLITLPCKRFPMLRSKDGHNTAKRCWLAQSEKSFKLTDDSQ